MVFGPSIAHKVLKTQAELTITLMMISVSMLDIQHWDSVEKHPSMMLFASLVMLQRDSENIIDQNVTKKDHPHVKHDI